RLIDLGGYTTDSVRRDIDGHLRNAFASWASGPPVQRVRQLLALEEAGLIEFTGPAMHIGIDEDAGRYTAHGGDNPPILCEGVLEAHLPPVDLPAYRSSLIGAWRERGEVQKDSWASRGSRRRMLTGSIAVDGLYAPVGLDDVVHERRLMVGVHRPARFLDHRGPRHLRSAAAARRGGRPAAGPRRRGPGGGSVDDLAVSVRSTGEQPAGQRGLVCRARRTADVSRWRA